MTGRTALLSFLVLLAASGGARADDARGGRVSVETEPPVVTVTGLPPGRYSVDLPALEYVFEIAAECAGDSLPHSLSINVADTRVTLSRDELEDAAHLQLTVPASQTAPVPVDDFCTVAPVEGGQPAAGPPEMRFAPESAAQEPGLLEIPGVLSAQVSLVCSNGEQSSMVWASQPLGVTLACASSTPGPPHSEASGPAPAEPRGAPAGARR